jgi:hypothetical protein
VFNWCGDNVSTLQGGFNLTINKAKLSCIEVLFKKRNYVSKENKNQAQSKSKGFKVAVYYKTYS